MGGGHRRREKVMPDEILCVIFAQADTLPEELFLIDPAQYAWKSFASGPIFFIGDTLASLAHLRSFLEKI